MSVQRELFRLWCALTGLVWMAAIFGGDGARIARQFQAGGWRAAFVHFTIVLIIAVASVSHSLGWSRCLLDQRPNFTKANQDSPTFKLDRPDSNTAKSAGAPERR